MPLPELEDSLGTKRAAHLLRRATFGATRKQIDTYAGLTPAEAVKKLFKPAPPLPAPVLPIDPKTGQEWFTNGATAAKSEDSDLETYFLGWIIGQMMSTGIPEDLSLPYSAREKIVFFLHTHFTTIRSKVASSRALYFQNQLFRYFALDGSPNPKLNFKELTVKVSVDNAMLRLLDGSLNVKGSANENYARELHELYSIGRGLEGSFGSTPEGDYGVYTEKDIQEAARVLSGWDFDDKFLNIDADTNIPRGKVKGSPENASSHDNDPKKFSAHFDNNEINPDPLLTNGTNATEESALDEIRQLVDQIYANVETPRNICRKIYRFFVWSAHTLEEAQTIEENIISEMAETFKLNGFKIQPVLEELLKSEHFYESVEEVEADDNIGGIIKSPLDLVLGTLRAFDVKLPDMQSNAVDFYKATNEIIALLGEMGMSFYEPYDVAGYEAYHQFPVYHRFWITPNALTRRYNFIRSLLSGSDSSMFKVDVYAFVKNFFTNEAPNARNLIKALALYFFPVTDHLDFEDTSPDDRLDSDLTFKRLNYFKGKLLPNLSVDDEGYWTQRWGDGADDLNDQLALLFNAMLQSPEYQLA